MARAPKENQPREQVSNTLASNLLRGLARGKEVSAIAAGLGVIALVVGVIMVSGSFWFLRRPSEN